VSRKFVECEERTCFMGAEKVGRNQNVGPGKTVTCHNPEWKGQRGTKAKNSR